MAKRSRKGKGNTRKPTPKKRGGKRAQSTRKTPARGDAGFSLYGLNLFDVGAELRKHTSNGGEMDAGAAKHHQPSKPKRDKAARSHRARYAANVRWYGKKKAKELEKFYQEAEPEDFAENAPSEPANYESATLYFRLPFFKYTLQKDEFQPHDLKTAGDEWADGHGDTSHYWRLQPLFKITFSDDLDPEGRHTWAQITPDDTGEGANMADDDDSDGDDFDDDDASPVPF
jgi:hypothetical protein